MAILLEDTGSVGKLDRAMQYVTLGHSAGLVLSPMKTPRRPRARQRTAMACVTALRDAHATVLWDPSTHIALMPNATELGPYDEWDLWPGADRDLSDPTLLVEHVDRVLERQVGELAVPPVAPTVIVTGGHSDSAEIALALAAAAAERTSKLRLHLVGTPEFFSEGRSLDDFVGVLAQLEPEEWLISVVRPDTTYPVLVESPGEIEGFCRTVYSLSYSAPVTVRHADLAGLVGLAAGAGTLTTGWNLGQRILARAGYQQQSGGRGAIERILCRGLISVLKMPEVAELTGADAALCSALVPGAAPVGKSAQWDHHINHLSGLAGRITGPAAIPDRCAQLLSDYRVATTEFGSVERLVAVQFGAPRWIEPFARGIEAFMIAEGWPA